MKHDGDDDLKDLVIAAFPLASATYEIARQLSTALPIRSRKHLLGYIDEHGLSVAGTKIRAASLDHVLPEAGFPIETRKELVTRLSGAVKVGAELAVAGAVAIRDAEIARLVAGFRAEPIGRAHVATGYLGGPSLFGGERAGKQKGR